MFKLASGSFIISLFLLCISCNKKDDSMRGSEKLIRYTVQGTNFRLNYIDAGSAFREGEIHSNDFQYEFRKGSGARVGISIFKQNPSDVISSWNIYVDGVLVANALGEGGAYFNVPY